MNTILWGKEWKEAQPVERAKNIIMILIKEGSYVELPQRVWFFSHFSPKLGTDLAIFVINRVSIFALQSSVPFFLKKLVRHHALLLPSAPFNACYTG